MPDRAARRVVRTHRRGAVCRRCGEVPGGPDADGRASAWARRDVRRPEPRPDRRRPAADGAGLPLPRFDGGRLVMAVDVSPWLRSDAPCSADRLFCHVHGRAKTASRFIPGWPYSFVAVLEPGATSWTAIPDAVRLGPADDATAVTADQLRGVVERFIAAGQWQAGDPEFVIVSDAGYDVTPWPGSCATCWRTTHFASAARPSSPQRVRRTPVNPRRKPTHANAETPGQRHDRRPAAGQVRPGYVPLQRVT